MRTLAIVFATAMIAMAQDSNVVNPSEGPPQSGWSALYFYDGSGRLEYICSAMSSQRLATQFDVTAATNATPIVVTVSTAHGLSDGAIVTVQLAQGNTAANGTWQVVASSATTLTLKDRLTGVNSVGNGAYVAGSAVLITNAPQSNQPVWAIKRLTYGASGLLRQGWSEGSTNALNAGKVCDNRASYGYQ